VVESEKKIKVNSKWSWTISVPKQINLIVVTLFLDEYKKGIHYNMNKNEE